MIDLYGLSSPNVMKIVIMLEECDVPFRFIPVNIWTGEQFADRFRALNPNSKTPVVVDPDGPEGRPVTIFESGAILIYLAEKFERFMPTEPEARYAALQWLMVQMAGIGPNFGQATHFRRFGPQDQPYALARFVTEVKRLCDVLETRLSEADYLGGSDYSVADMATWPWISMYHEVNGVDLDALPALRRWTTAIRERPAVARVEEQWESFTSQDMAKREAATPEGFDRLLGRGRYSRA